MSEKSPEVRPFRLLPHLREVGSLFVGRRRRPGSRQKMVQTEALGCMLVTGKAKRKSRVN